MHKILRHFLASYGVWLDKYYLVLWLGLGLLGGLALLGFSRLQIQVNTDKLFLQQDDNARALRKFKEKYQIGESVGIYIETEASLLQPELLDRLSLLSRELQQLPFVRSVQGLDSLWLQSRGDDPRVRLENFASFVAKFPETASLHSRDWSSMWYLIQLYPDEQLPMSSSLLDRAQLADLQNVAQNLQQKSGGAVLNLQLPALQEAGLQKGKNSAHQKPSYIFSALLEKLLEQYQEAEPRLHFIPVGLPVNSYRLETELSADLIRMLSIAALICLLCIILLLPSLLAALAALLCVLCNILFLFGASAWLNLPVDKTFIMIPVLLGFASSISYCVHLEKSWGSSPKHRGRRCLGETLGQNLRPLSFAALSTVFALLSFLSVPVPIIRTAGLQSAMAVILSYSLSLTLFCSIMLQKKGESSAAQSLCPRFAQVVKFYLARLRQAIYRPIIHTAVLCYQHRKTSIALAALLLGTSLYLLPQLRVDLSTESVLGTRLEYVQQLMRVSNSEIGAGGFYNIDILFADEPLQAKHLQQIKTLEQHLRQSELVKNVTSITTFLHSVQKIYRDSSQLPSSVRQSRQALVTWERIFGGRSSEWYSPKDQSVRLLVQVYQSSSSKNIAHMEEVRRLAQEIFSPSDSGSSLNGSQVNPQVLPQVRPLGGIFQLAIMNQYITRGLLRSFGLSLLLVALLLFLLLRSLRLGLIALVPNLLPALLTGGVIVLMGRQLEFVSMTVGPMIIGLAVDDTIYFLGYVQQLLRAQPKHRDLGPLLQQALQHIAPALITTTIILCALFASMVLSQADNIRYMGIYTSLAMLIALFADLFLTPILLRWAYQNKS